MVNKKQLVVVESRLADRSNDELKELILALCKNNSGALEMVLAWAIPHEKAGNTEVADTLALQYWKKAEKLISKLNDYGGGSEKNEDAAWSYLEEIGELAPSLSVSARLIIVKDLNIQYQRGNSGLDVPMISCLSCLKSVENLEDEF